MSPSSTFAIPHSDGDEEAAQNFTSDPDIRAHCDIEFDEDECAITTERLHRATRLYCQAPTAPCSAVDADAGGVGGVHGSGNASGSLKKERMSRARSTCTLTPEEMQSLQREQKTIRKSLFVSHDFKKAVALGGSFISGGRSINYSLKSGEILIEAEDEEEEKDPAAAAVGATTIAVAPPQDDQHKKSYPRPSFSRSKGGGVDPVMKNERDVGTIKAQIMKAKIRSRLDNGNDGVLGIARTRSGNRHNSMLANDKFMAYNRRMSSHSVFSAKEEAGEEEKKDMDVEDISYVRKPDMARIIRQYQAMQNRPKYTLKQVVLSRRFHLYAHRFGNAQYERTLVYPTLRQPHELYTSPWLCRECKDEKTSVTEKQRTRPKGHRFIIAADTQFGILMDGFAMDFPSWTQEIEISRKCVAQINAMHGTERPLYVCVCGDLVDTESSFSGAIASWKKVMSGWERNLVFEQQVKDFKRVWAGLDPDIALVCMCGNHDVGNRPTKASIEHWTSSFGDDYLAFWANATFNICLNNCLFSNPSGAMDLFDEQLQWLEEKLAYARKNDATHIFVYGHFPWFLKHEEESDDHLTSYSAAPEGWGPPGSQFADSYFTVPYEYRKIAMALFRKYDVTACFSGHFHQNVVAQTSWGMPMIVTGPLSMNLNSNISHELSNGETNGIGMRIVDVGERGEFTHNWTLLDGEEELFEHAVERCLRQSAIENGEEANNDDDGDERRRSLFNQVVLSPLESSQWHSTEILDVEVDGEE